MNLTVLNEAATRGGAASVLMILSILFFRSGKGFGVERLGALFSFSAAAYTISSANFQWEATGAIILVLHYFGMLTPVFFWWFCTALFDDDFKWYLWRFIPLGALTIAFYMLFLKPTGVREYFHNILIFGSTLPMLLHVLWLALVHRNEDLVEQRRAFRLAIAVLVGVTGIVITLFETMVVVPRSVGEILNLIQAGTIFSMTMGMAIWIIPPVTVLKQTKTPSNATAQAQPTSENSASLTHLKEFMADGTYRREGLTIGVLAEMVALPEHRLRWIINQELGFRNFNAFLNSYRLAEAKEILSDPAQARRQITQIALDLGYGSIGPFNRAFKSETEMTPTEFRKSALNGPSSP
ncbi:MAG: AraC family transcriptional regulator [Pseudomonadota bacterium]